MKVADIFLYEAVDDFWESGKDSSKLISCVIKLMTVFELLLKEQLESINPLLVLDRIDPLDLSQVAGFASHLIHPETETQPRDSKKTARFHDILSRAKKFITISNDEEKALRFLYDIRNNISHYHQITDVNEIEVNRILTDMAFPLLKKLLLMMQPKGLSLGGRRWIQAAADEELWGKLDSTLGKSGMELALQKKFNHYRSEYLRNMRPMETEEVSHATDVWCPACGDHSLQHVLGLDVDWNPDGALENVYRRMKCNACNLELDEEDIREIEHNVNNWIPAENRNSWNFIDERYYQID